MVERVSNCESCAYSRQRPTYTYRMCEHPLLREWGYGEPVRACAVASRHDDFCGGRLFKGAT